VNDIKTIAQYLSAKLAFGIAAWELVYSGMTFQTGGAGATEIGWRTGDRAGSIRWSDQRFLLFHPGQIQRPSWHAAPSDLFDADLYLLHVPSLTPQIEQALRLSLDCFRYGLFVPCVAMLGAASEGAWIEMGNHLSRRFSSESAASRLASKLNGVTDSVKTKIDQICHLYELPFCKAIQQTSGIDGRRLRQIQQWSDQIRESRNVLHWGAQPTVPNTYEKVGILLMDAVSELNDLRQVKENC
jgi:hypothetical protein